MKVIKRDGRIVEYNREKIYTAINKANGDVPENERVKKKQIDNIIRHIEELNKKRMLVEDIQDHIETELMKIKKYALAKSYIIYRYTRALVRKSNTTDQSILSLIKNGNKQFENNKNAIIYKQRDLIAGEVSKDLSKRVFLPNKISEAIDKGLLYFHDINYFIQPMINSIYLNYPEMLKGLTINDIDIHSPTNFQEALIILLNIIHNVSSSIYGEITIDIKYLSNYLREKENIDQSLKMFLLELNTLINTNGKTPKVSILLNLDSDNKNLVKLIYKIIELNNYNNPRLIYVINENNNLNNGKYDYITELILKKKEIYLISAKVMQKNFNNIFAPINHYFLPPYKDNEGKSIIEGRFNQGIVSINLPQITIMANKKEDIFFQILDERLELCYEALLIRYHSLIGTISDISPILWQNGAIARNKKGEKIDKYLKNGYSSLALGYVGLKEMALNMKDDEKEQEKFAIKVLKYLKKKSDDWKKQTGLGFTVYGINNSLISHAFISLDKEEYGEIKDITNKEYYTNIDSKLEIIKKYQNINYNIGIHYLSINKNDNMKDIINYIDENILYIGLINQEGGQNEKRND